MSSDDTTHVAHSQTTDVDYDSHYHDDPYAQPGQALTVPTGPPPPPSQPPPAPPADPEDQEEDGMLRMSFLEHLEELRSRLIQSLAGIAVSFFVCLYFADKLWLMVSTPAVSALHNIGAPEKLVILSPMDGFTTIYMKVPLLASAFLSSPWLLYQVWAFISPGLYKKERRFAAPFVITTAGLFILGGLFAYFVAFRFGLEFLLGLGYNINVQPTISIVEYFDLFVNVTLGIGLVFEMPVIIFFLTFLRITTPKFLISHSRYAILIIVIIAAIVTPTPDIFNLTLFAVPMIVLYFVGVFASYLLVLRRDNRSFPWASVLAILLGLVGVIALVVYFGMWKYGLRLVPSWPYLVK